MENNMILDSETTGTVKPFAYDIGYTIINEAGEVIERKHFVVEQTWHNLPLFETAYYKEKRPKYIALMRAHKAEMKKYGHIMQEMKRDIKKYDVKGAYAYNSAFDDNVLAFNCDWYKCENPLDTVPVYDIMGYAGKFITNTPEYKAFCEQYNFFTDSGNYSQTAETVYRYITGNIEFEEAHIGVMDCDIETNILLDCLARGAELGKDYQKIRILERQHKTPYTIKINNKVFYQGEYLKKTQRNNVWYFTE